LVVVILVGRNAFAWWRGFLEPEPGETGVEEAGGVVRVHFPWVESRLMGSRWVRSLRRKRGKGDEKSDERDDTKMVVIDGEVGGDELAFVAVNEMSDARRVYYVRLMERMGDRWCRKVGGMGLTS
jgi:hypothetical protein